MRIIIRITNRVKNRLYYIYDHEGNKTTMNSGNSIATIAKCRKKRIIYTSRGNKNKINLKKTKYKNLFNSKISNIMRRSSLYDDTTCGLRQWLVAMATNNTIAHDNCLAWLGPHNNCLAAPQLLGKGLAWARNTRVC